MERITVNRQSLPRTASTFLAPMEGVTHPVFRSTIAELGPISCLCTEFIRVTDTAPSRQALAREVVFTPGVPLSVQVMGRNVESMRTSAAILAAAGADAIDINMGCPTRRAVKGGVGAAMLKDPELLKRVVSEMRAAVGCRLSAKIRAGFDDASRVVELAQIVEAGGADYIAVHPRTRADHYRGVADWRIIRLLKAKLTIPVIGNGDAWYAADALRMVHETGCDAVMIGRPALRNPWIFRQVAELQSGRVPFAPDGEVLLGFLATVAGRYERGFGRGALGRLKELIRWMARAIDDGGRFRKMALRTQSVSELLHCCTLTFGGLSAEQLDLDASGHLGLERCGSADEGAANLVGQA